MSDTNPAAEEAINPTEVVDANKVEEPATANADAKGDANADAKGDANADAKGAANGAAKLAQAEAGDDVSSAVDSTDKGENSGEATKPAESSETNSEVKDAAEEKETATKDEDEKETATKHDNEEATATKDDDEEDTATKDDEKKTRDYRDSRGTRGRGNGRFNNRNGDGYLRKPKPEEDYAQLPESSDPAEIRDQVEFYFSLHNLTTDSHMFREMGGPTNRPIPIKHITSFKRMKRFTPYSAVVAALRESDSLDVVDDGDFSGTHCEGVRRKDPITVDTQGLSGDRKDDTYWEALHFRFRRQSGNHMERSIYVKNFGDEAKAGQIAIEKFFKPYGAVVVRKRRDEDNKWKGSVFVEFESEEAQKQFLALESKPEFNGNVLTIMGKKEYVDMKCAEKGILPDQQRQPGWQSRGGRGRGRGRGRGNFRGRGRGGYDRPSRDYHGDSRDWNKRRDNFQKSGDYRNGGRNGSHYDKYDRKDQNRPAALLRDENGIPIVRDTRGEPESSPTNKRKAEDDKQVSPKKAKIEIKEDA